MDGYCIGPALWCPANLRNPLDLIQIVETLTCGWAFRVSKGAILAIDERDPLTGYPKFLDTGAPDIGVDPTEAAKYASEVGNRIMLANKSALDAYDYRRKGLRGKALDTGYEYEHDGTGWVLVDAQIAGRVNRSTTPSTFPSSGYTNVAANTFWTPSVARGFAAYDNGWTIPTTGRYWVSYEIRAAGSFLSGLSVNYSGSAPSLILATSSAVVQGVAAGTVSAPVSFSAGDVVRPYLLAATGTPAWAVSSGFFGIEWTGSD